VRNWGDYLAGSPRKKLLRASQLVGVGLLAGTSLLAVLAGPATASEPVAGTEVPGSAVPIGTFTAGTPFSSGQVISVVIPANSTFAPTAGINIEECAAPGGAVPTDPSTCDGVTHQGDTVDAGTDGSVDYTNYTVYAIPDPSIGDTGAAPVCNLSNECVLYIGEAQTDFTQPHFFSQPFYVAPTAGDSGANPGDGSPPPPPTGADANTSTVTAAAIPPSPVGDGKDPATVTVRLFDSSSVPVPGKTVTLAAGTGSSVITPASAVSAADGTAIFTVTDTTAEKVTYSATDTTDSVTIVATASVTFAAPIASAANSRVAASPTQVPSNGTTPSTITVTLHDQAAGTGQPMAGKVVTLAPSGGSSVITTVSGTTDSTGTATFTVTDAMAEVVTYTAKDTTDNVTVTSTAAVTFGTIVVSGGASTVTATDSTAEANAGTSVTVTLLSAGGSPVSGKSVSLSASPSATATITPNSVVTNGAGQANFSVSDSTAESVVFSAEDVTDSIAITPTATVAFQVAGPSASASTIAASPTSVPADGLSSSTIIVTILDQFKNPLVGKAVTVQLTDASLNAAAPPVSGEAVPVMTNSSGQAEFALVDTTAETVTVGATDTTDNVVLSSTVGVTFSSGAADAGASMVSVKPTSVPADGKTASTITVTLLDHVNNAVAGKTVTLTPSGGNSVVTTVSGTTNSAGVATFTVTDNTAEVVSYTATDTTDNLPITAGVAVTFGTPPAPPPAVADSVVSANAASAPADGSSAVTVTVSLSDANGDFVAGKTVSLSPQGGHSVVTTVRGVTDSNGEASFTVADATAESVTYTATDTTDNLPITGQSVTVVFATAATAATGSTTTTITTTTASGGSTTTPAAGSADQSGAGGGASTAAAGTVSASSDQLALTGAPSLLPWLCGLGLLLLLGGSIGRRRVRTGT